MRIASLLLLGVSLAPLSAQNVNGIDLGPVVKAVNDALVEAQSNSVSGFPQLNSVTLELSGTTAKSADGKIKFLVFSVGPGGETDRAMTLSIKLAAPATTNKMNASAFSEADLKIALARAINAAKVAYVQVHSGSSVSPALGKLIDTSVDLEVKFTIQKTIQGGIDTAQLLPIGLSVTGKVQTQQVQTVKLSFGK